MAFVNRIGGVGGIVVIPMSSSTPVPPGGITPFEIAAPVSGAAPQWDAALPTLWRLPSAAQVAVQFAATEAGHVPVSVLPSFASSVDFLTVAGPTVITPFTSPFAMMAADDCSGSDPAAAMFPDLAVVRAQMTANVPEAFRALIAERWPIVAEAYARQDHVACAFGIMAIAGELLQSNHRDAAIAGFETAARLYGAMEMYDRQLDALLMVNIIGRYGYDSLCDDCMFDDRTRTVISRLYPWMSNEDVSAFAAIRATELIIEWELHSDGSLPLEADLASDLEMFEDLRKRQTSLSDGAQQIETFAPRFLRARAQHALWEAEVHLTYNVIDMADDCLRVAQACYVQLGDTEGLQRVAALATRVLEKDTKKLLQLGRLVSAREPLQALAAIADQTGDQLLARRVAQLVDLRESTSRNISPEALEARVELSHGLEMLLSPALVGEALASCDRALSFYVGNPHETLQEEFRIDSPFALLGLLTALTVYSYAARLARLDGAEGGYVATLQEFWRPFSGNQKAIFAQNVRALLLATRREEVDGLSQAMMELIDSIHSYLAEAIGATPTLSVVPVPDPSES